MGQEISIHAANEKINEVLIVLMSATYFINWPIAFSMRPVDIIFIIFAAFNIRKIKFAKEPISILILIFWLMFFASIINGIVKIGIVQYENFIMVYKYLVPFVLLKILLSIKFKNGQIRFLLKILFFSLLFIVLYTIYLKLVWRDNLNYRPSFPFTKAFPSKSSGYLGDAHLLSAYLSTGLLAVILCGIHKLFSIAQKKYYFVIFCVTAFTALILTGSRNGIVTLGSTCVLWCILNGVLFFKRHNLSYIFRKLKYNWQYFELFKKRIGSRFILGSIFTIISFGFLSYSALLEFNLRFNKKENTLVLHKHQIPQGISRTFYFDFLNEQSSLGRINKQIAAYNITSVNGLLIGVGMQSCPNRFYDGTIGNLLVNSGLVGASVFITIIFLFLVYMQKRAKENENTKEFQILFWVFFNYSFACMVTEFFLVSRSIIPFILFIGLIGSLILTPNELAEPEVKR